MRPKTAFALFCLFAIPLVALAQEVASPDLSGAWLINEAQSETLREQMRELMAQDVSNPRTRARWDRIQTRDRMHMQNSPFGRLEIDHVEPQVTIQYRGGRLRELFTDGRELEPETDFGVESMTVAWQATRLIIDSETERGRLTEFWELSDDGQRLFVTTQMEMGERFDGPVTFRRVYDKEPPGVGPAPGAPAEAEEPEPGH